MIAFAVRNLRVFFRDRASVFFSLIAVLIIIGLYAAFLGNTLTQGMEGMPGARFLMDSWIMAGLLAVASITTTLGAAGVMVDDQNKGISKDLRCLPLKRSTIVGGYLLSAVVVGVIMSTAAFAAAEIYIALNGGKLLSAAAVLKVLGLIILSSAASGAMVSLLISFLKTPNALAVASTVVGTLSGFLMGIYVPISVLPKAVQTVIKAFPIAHAAALLRQVFMEVPLAESFAGAPPQVVDEFKQSLGVVFTIGGEAFSAAGSVAILLATTAVFFVLAVWRMLKR